MTLEEYTNLDKDDAFIYWIESRLDKLGSIWGGSAFKFGIYCRDKTDAKEVARAVPVIFDVGPCDGLRRLGYGDEGCGH